MFVLLEVKAEVVQPSVFIRRSLDILEINLLLLLTGTMGIFGLYVETIQKRKRPRKCKGEEKSEKEDQEEEKAEDKGNLKPEKPTSPKGDEPESLRSSDDAWPYSLHYN